MRQDPRALPGLVARGVFWGVVLSLFTAGCGKDDGPTQPEPYGSVAGTVLEIDSGVPVDSALVILVDPDSLAARSVPVRTDAQGRFRFDHVRVGEYSVFLYHRNLVVFDRTASLVRVVQGETAVHDMRLIQSPLWSGYTPNIKGTVVSADGGRPVAGVFVEDAIWGLIGQDIPALLAGISVPDWAVTDSLGRFEVRVMEVLDEHGTRLGLDPISSCKSGFSPATIVGHGGSVFPGLGGPLPLPPTGGDGSLHLTVTLRPLAVDGPPAEALGAVSGRVHFFQTPEAGVLVGLSLAQVAAPDTFTAKSAMTPVPDKVAVTDSQGRFLITGVVPGRYTVVPGYLSDDGIAGIYRLPEWPVDSSIVYVTAGDTVWADAAVIKGMRPLTPAVGSAVSGDSLTLTWSAAPTDPGYGAVQYRLSYGFGYVLDNQVTLAAPHWQTPDSLLIPGKHIRWWVEAQAQIPGRMLPVTIATFEAAATFTAR